MSLTTEKVDYTFMYIQLFVSFFLFPCGFPGENRANLKKLFDLDSRLRWEAQYPRYTENTIIFLSAIAAIERLMQVIF